MLELDFVSGAYKDQLSLLQPYMRRVELAEGAVEVSEVLEEALAAPGLALYVPLLQKPKVQDLTKDPKGEAWFRLGKLFAHGTYLDYLRKWIILGAKAAEEYSICDIPICVIAV